MATVAPSGGGVHAASEKRDGGTVVRGGNIADTKFETLALRTLADDQGESYGSKVVLNDGTGAATTDRVGVSGVWFPGTVARDQTSTEWVMMGITDTLNGNLSLTATNSLQGKGTGHWSMRDNIHSRVTTRRYGTSTFDIYAVPSTQIMPGLTKGAGAGDESEFVQSDGSTAATDDAATPSRSVPGELTYYFGAQNQPTTDEYKAKDSAES